VDSGVARAVSVIAEGAPVAGGPPVRRVLPVEEVLAGLLPSGGLVRGEVVAVTGPAASSLALALVAAAGRAGHWVVLAGWDDVGLDAATELGVVPERLLMVHLDGPGDAASRASALAGLVGVVDVVVLGPVAAVTGVPARRLANRARRAGTVVVVVAPDRLDVASGPGARQVAAWPLDCTVAVVGSCWEGTDCGHRRLRARRLNLEVSGRGRASRPARADLWLPDEAGRPASASPPVPVVVLPTGESGIVGLDTGPSPVAG